MLQEYSVTTNMSYEQSIKAFEEKLTEIKFGVLCKLNLPDKFKEKGLDFEGKFTIFEICNPVEAKNALEKNSKVAYFLPCKILIHERDGVGVVEMLKPSSMISELNDADLDIMARRIDEKLIGVMDSMK